MTPNEQALLAVTIVFAVIAGAAIGWAIVEHCKRKRVERRRNDAIAEAARLRDELAALRRGRITVGGDVYEHMRRQVVAEHRFGLGVQRPEAFVRITDPTA